jgi:hypothetical protein
LARRQAIGSLPAFIKAAVKISRAPQPLIGLGGNQQRPATGWLNRCSGDQLSRGRTAGSPQTRCARMNPGDCKDARTVRLGGVLVLHRTEGGGGNRQAARSHWLGGGRSGSQSLLGAQRARGTGRCGYPLCLVGAHRRCCSHPSSPLTAQTEAGISLRSLTGWDVVLVRPLACCRQPLCGPCRGVDSRAGARDGTPSA